MKYFLSIMFLGIPGLAHSQMLTVQETAVSSATAYTILVASQPAVDVASATLNGRLMGAYAIEVYCPSASTNTINCAFDSQVSTSISSGYYGREVAPGTGIVFHISIPFVKLFCMSQSILGGTRCTVTQLK